MQAEVFNNGTAAGGTLTLSLAAQEVTSIIGLVGAATAVAATKATVGTTSPTGTQAQFSGTPDAPSKTITLGTGWAASSLLIVVYREAGSLTPDK